MRVRNARDTIDISCAEYIKYHHSIKYVHESNQCRSVNCLCCELGRTTFFIDIAIVRSLYLQHQSIVSIVTMPEPICHCCNENISLLPLIWGFKGTFLVKYFQYPRENCKRFICIAFDILVVESASQFLYFSNDDFNSLKTNLESCTIPDQNNKVTK